MPSQKRIRIDYSDGVRDYVPANQSKEFPSGTTFDYYRIPGEDDARYIRWLKTLGAFLKSETSLKDTPEEYTLAAFPDNYTFLEHCKSQGEGKKHRTDIYLFGHPGGSRFRSINEFMPHLLWLAKDRDHVPTNCTCKLCPSGSATNGNRSRAGRAKQVFTGMSEIAKVQLAKAQADMKHDLSALAPVYRIGEVVCFQDAACLVISAKTVGEAKDVTDALSKHMYNLVECDAPYTQMDNVPGNLISPWLSFDSKAEADLAVVHAASPIAKYNITQSAHLPSALPGPCYVAWMLGPEKIYQNDVVRLSATTAAKDTSEVMLLSHILLDVATQTVRVRGDIFQLVDPTAQPVPVDQDERAVPDRIADLARALSKRARFVSTPGLEFDLDLADVHGRYYGPEVHPGALASVRVTRIERGRVSVLPEPVVAHVERRLLLLEQSSVEESAVPVQLGTRGGKVLPTTTTTTPRAPTNEALGSPAAAEEVAPPLQSAVGDDAKTSTTTTTKEEDADKETKTVEAVTTENMAKEETIEAAAAATNGKRPAESALDAPPSKKVV